MCDDKHELTNFKVIRRAGLRLWLEADTKEVFECKLSIRDEEQAEVISTFELSANDTEKAVMEREWKSYIQEIKAKKMEDTEMKKTISVEEAIETIKAAGNEREKTEIFMKCTVKDLRAYVERELPNEKRTVSKMKKEDWAKEASRILMKERTEIKKAISIEEAMEKLVTVASDDTQAVKEVFEHCTIATLKNYVGILDINTKGFKKADWVNEAAKKFSYDRFSAEKGKRLLLSKRTPN